MYEVHFQKVTFPKFLDYFQKYFGVEIILALSGILAKKRCGLQNNSSQGVRKTEDQLFMLQEELLFPRSVSCQPRSEGCPAKAGGQDWTFRPRLAVRPRK